MAEEPSTQDSQPSQTAETVTQNHVQNNPPQSTVPSQPQSGSSAGQNSDGPLSRLEAALAALPERVAAAVREANPQHPPRRQSPPSNASSNSGTQSSGQTQTGQQNSPSEAPKRRTFADWWFSEPTKKAK